MSEYVMHADVEFTRRKRLHHIIDDKGETCWSGKSLLSAFDYLVEVGVYEFRVEGQDSRPGFRVMIHRD
jgi:hypothetical protein